MGNNKDKGVLPATNKLRRRAEDRLRAKTNESHPHKTKEDPKKLLHELEVHQIELEMQNAEMHRIQEELILSRDKYVEL